MDRTDAGPQARAAVIVFVRAPELGAVKTRLAAEVGAETALRIYRRMAEHVVGEAAALPEVDLRVHFTPPDAAERVAGWLGHGAAYIPQAEGDLGCRMSAAFHQAWADGHERVVIVGSDLPTLSREHLHDAIVALDDHPAVIGPAADGGYWLIGLCQPAPAIFADVPWSTPEVLRLTLQRLSESGVEPYLLPELRDVDEASDLPEGWVHGEPDQR